MSNFREGIKNRTMDSFLVVIQKLLSCSSRFSQSTKQGNPCQIFAGLKAQILKNVSLRESGKILPGSDSHFLWLDFLVARCGQIVGRKCLKTP